VAEENGPPEGTGERTQGAAWRPLLTSNDARRLRSSLILLPSIGAIVLGLAYGLGSVFKLGQIHHAGLNFDDTFTRIPLQEILTEGVGIEVLVAAAFPLFGMVVLVSERLEERLSGRQRVTPPPIPSGVVNAVSVAVGGVVVLVLPWPITVALMLGGVAIGSYTFLWARPSSMRHKMGALGVAGPTIFVVVSFALPHPFPQAHLQTKAGQTVVGPLVTINDGAWIVGTRRPSGFISVPYSEIASARATSRSDFSQRRLYRVLLSVL
jgi:hypothetical protein